MESIHLFLLLFLQNVLLIVSHPPAANVWTFCHLFSLVPNPQGQVQPTPSFGAAGRNALPIPSRSSGREISSPNTDKAVTELNKKQLHPPPVAFQGLVSDLTVGFPAPRSLRVYRPPWEAGPKIRGGWRRCDLPWLPVNLGGSCAGEGNWGEKPSMLEPCMTPAHPVRAVGISTYINPTYNWIVNKLSLININI